MNNGSDPVDGLIDAFASGQVTGEVLDTVGGLARAPAQDAQFGSRLLQLGHEVAPKGASTAGDQNG
jgi:hypothetical protein